MSCAPVRSSEDRSALLRFAPVSLAMPTFSVFLRSTPLRSAPLRSVPFSFTLKSSAVDRFVSLRIAPARFAPVKITFVRSAFVKSARIRFASLRVARAVEASLQSTASWSCSPASSPGPSSLNSRRLTRAAKSRDLSWRTRGGGICSTKRSRACSPRARARSRTCARPSSWPSGRECAAATSSTSARARWTFRGA